jgi:hypothetical protein
MTFLLIDLVTLVPTLIPLREPFFLRFRRLDVRNGCILIFQIFHDAASIDLRSRQILLGTNQVNGR